MAVSAASNTISGGIKWTGLASDTDFGSVVEAMIATERRVITKQETWKSQWQEKLEAINNLDVRLTALKTAANDYGTRDKLLSRKGTSSDEKVVTVTNTSTAATGSYDVEVADETNAISTSRSYDVGADIGMNYYTNDKGQPIDKNGNVLSVRSWDVDSAMALLSSKLPAGSKLPLSFDETYNNFLDADGQVVARYDMPNNCVFDTNGNRLFGLKANDWILETTLGSLAGKLGATDLPLTYDNGTGEFFDSNNVLVAEMNTATSEIHRPGDPGDVLLTLGNDGIPSTWETDNALAVLSQKFPTNLPLTFDPATNEFLDSTSTAVATLDPATNEIYDTADPPALIYTMSRHTMTNWDDANIIKFLEEHDDVPDSVTRPFTFDATNNQYISDNGFVVAELDPVMGTIKLPGADGATLLALDTTGQVIDMESKEPIISADTSRHYYGPMTFTMNGKTLSLEYDPDYDPETDGIQPNVFSEKCSMEELAEIINASVTAAGGTAPNIRAEIEDDKTRREDRPNAAGDLERVDVVYKRLRIIGQDSGSENNIEIVDPTNLCMDENYVDPPLTTQWVGSTAQPVLGVDSEYTGHVNKNITFHVSQGGNLGQDTIIITWVDTESKGGTFTIEPDDWDSVNGRLKEDVEIEQGVTVNFNLGSDNGGNTLRKDNAFTIDCQNPVLQKAADSGMAQSDKWVHKGFSSQTLPVVRGSGGRFDFSYAGVEYSIPIKDGSTLSAMAEAINSSNVNPGVIASVLNDGMGTATSYKLVLTGAHSGSEHEIRVLDSTNISEISMEPEDFEHARTATNSMFRIDGYPGDGLWTQRPGNEVSDVLDGTILQLQSEGKATINVVNDIAGMTDKVKQIIEAVNYAMSYIQEQTRYAGGKFTINVLKDGTVERTTEGGEASGVMIGNYGFQISNSEIKNIMSSQIFSQDEYIQAIDPDGEKNLAQLPAKARKEMYEAFLKDNGLIYTRLSDIGIAFKDNATDDYSKGGGGAGAYVIESSKLDEALRKNPEAVLKLFTFKPDDTFPVHTKYEDEADRPNLSGGVLTKMFYSMSDLTRSGDVYDKKTGDMIQPAKGIMRVLSENYSNIISGIDDKIDRETTRITLKQQRLEEKFSRLEVLIAQLNQQSKSLDAELEKLAK